ncbi:hypothetical protein QJS04_geneDACA012298 [Acorus gramineus]|uniref:Vacuolar iron transporter n=1 Tax=Acorus gramineus TaxID=55184 RepID=A0AAV9A1Q3_ACOGR|nr:hypothetical protein QJS04_geneDACA012298 [Acorus gramineus]
MSSQIRPSLSPPPPQPQPNQSITNPSIHLTIPPTTEPTHQDDHPSTDYSTRSQWLRAAVLGANDGLVSVASLMIGVGTVNQTAKAMLVSGLAGLVAGACSMVIGEFVSVYAQYDIELTQMKRENAFEEKEKLPSPAQVAGASALAFALGALLPLLAGGFIRPWGARLRTVCGVSSLGLAGFGAVGPC